MDLHYTDRAKQWGEGFVLIQQASKRLEEVLGSHSAEVKAEWDRIEDQTGRILYTLRISDWIGSVEVQLDLNDLTIPSVLRIRLYRLWGDLLKFRSDEQRRKVHALVEAGEGG